MATITSANSSFVLTIGTVFPVPQKMQGYAADDMFSLAETEFAESVMGADGHLSYGYVPSIKELEFVLMPNSPSVTAMDTLINAQNAAKEAFRLDASIFMPSIGKRFVFTNGVLKSGKAMPDAKKTLDKQSYKLQFESCIAFPI